MSLKLLIVDDNTENRELALAVFQRLAVSNVEIFQAACGVEALEVAFREKPVLILLDIMMPGMSGFEVCQKIKDCTDLAKTRIIMLTATDETADRERAKQVGADGYIVKPYDILKLRRETQQYLVSLTASTEAGMKNGIQFH